MTKNNKGQTLVTFIVVLPILLIIMATVIDVGLMYYEKNKLDNLNIMTTEYALDNLDVNKINILIKKNDGNVKIEKINNKNNTVEISLSKEVESIFGKIIGIKEYKLTSKYIGIKDKKEIKKG